VFVVVWIALLLLVVLVGILIANLGFFFLCNQNWNFALITCDEL